MPLIEYPDALPSALASPDVPPMTLYAVLRELTSIEADIAAFEASIARLKGRQTALMATATTAIRSRTPRTVYVGADGEMWTVIAGCLVRVETVDAMTVDVPCEASDEPAKCRMEKAVDGFNRIAKEEGLNVATTFSPSFDAVSNAPTKHRSSCLCPSCYDIKSNVSPFVDR